MLYFVQLIKCYKYVNVCVCVCIYTRAEGYSNVNDAVGTRHKELHREH